MEFGLTRLVDTEPSLKWMIILRVFLTRPPVTDNVSSGMVIALNREFSLEITTRTTPEYIFLKYLNNRLRRNRKHNADKNSETTEKIKESQNVGEFSESPSNAATSDTIPKGTPTRRRTRPTTNRRNP